MCDISNFQKTICSHGQISVSLIYVLSCINTKYAPPIVYNNRYELVRLTGYHVFVHVCLITNCIQPQQWLKHVLCENLARV